MNSGATDCEVHTAELEEHVSAILINAQLYSEMGFDMHLDHGLRPNGGCTCSQGRGCTKGPGKHPRGGAWQKYSTRDVNEIRRRLRENPNSNLGIRTGNGLVVIDIDPKDGGFETLAKLEAELGPLPRKHTVQTGSGGLHIYLSVTVLNYHRIGCSQGKDKGGLGSGVDVRARGGQVVAAPSIHASGNSYRWLTLAAGPLSPLPAAWLDRLAKVTSDTTSERKELPKVRRQRQRRTTKKQVNKRERQATTVAGVRGAISNILGCDPKSDIVSRVGRALIEHQVTDNDMTNGSIHRLISRLKNIPELADKTGLDTLPIFDFWFGTGRENMTEKRPEKVQGRWIETWDDWAMSKTGPAWDAARKIVTPAYLTEAEESKHVGKFILRAICKEIQEQARLGMWYLTCRTNQDVMKSLGIEVTFKTTNVWMNDLVAEGFLVKCNYRDPDYPDTQYYMTAVAAERCAERDRQRQQAQQLPPAIATRLSTPDDLIAPTYRLTAEQPLSPFSNTLATAGRDEPLSTDFASVRTKQLHAVQRN